MELVQGENVLKWIIDGTGASVDTTTQAIGLLDGDGLVAAAAYSGYNEQSVVVHQRIIGRTNRDYWYAVFDYPFNDLGVKCLIGMVHSDNEQALRLNKHLGFKQEAVLKGVAPGGLDIVIFIMWREDCRFLNWKANGKKGIKTESTESTGLHHTCRTAVGSTACGSTCCY